MSLPVLKHGTLEPSLGDRKRGIDLSLLIVSCLSLLKVSSWGVNFPSFPGSHLPAASGEATSYVLKQDASPSTRKDLQFLGSGLAAATSDTMGMMEALPMMGVPHLEEPMAGVVMRQAIRGKGPPLSKVWTQS